MRLVENGDATVADIDIAMKLGAGHPMGPLQLCDYIGLDTIKYVVDGWHLESPNDNRFEPCALLDNLVKEGKLGKKSGEGFYRY
ncbi:hypothetical protein AB6A40_011115 [Gnathostoma spinigerum]|uniref:3-hydroxyacyl-CoA dehydrogenase C-terminal domain-containing protein n=1 Tax=Gnathostoma spinigerum TaxID=75299 RepID=A0ABD6EYH4_9BILA